MNKVLKFPEEYMKEYDKDNLIKDINDMGKHLVKGYDLAKNLKLKGNYNKVVIIGMGGSYIAGFLLQKLLKDSKVPIITSHDYHIPIDVGSESLVIFVSYSGDTEETISALREAVRKSCTIVSLTTGGKIGEISKLAQKEVVNLPEGLQPRASIGYQISALLAILEAAGVVKGIKSVLHKTSKSLGKNVFNDVALKLSERLIGKVPCIYSSELFYPVAYRWKTQMNENAKIFAIANSLSEQNHNEILASTNSENQGDFHIIMIKSEDDEPKIKKRMILTKEIMQKDGLDVTEIGIKGESLLTRMLSGVLIGDLTSYYLALRYETNPSSVNNIDKIKEKIK